MERINIFVASSCELSEDRIIIGDYIRRLNDVYEPQGIAVRMNCWEDYNPEYTGERKQDEYNRDLVLKSQIVVGLFKTRCGKYTQEEINVAIQQLGIGSVHCYRKISKNGLLYDSPDITSFFKEKGISPTIYQSESDLEDIIKALLDKYIDDHRLHFSEIGVSSTSVKLYATIANDLGSLEFKLGNIIRVLDDICERYLDQRCHLYPYGNINDIPSSNYYMSFLKDELSTDKAQELSRAVDVLNQGTLSKIAIYIADNGNIDCSAWSHIIKPEDYFHIPFNNLDLVKFNILLYLISEKNKYALSDYCEYHDGAICLLDYKLSTIEQIPDLNNNQLVKSILPKLKEIERKILIRKQFLGDQFLDEPDNEYVDLITAKKRYENQINNIFKVYIDVLIENNEVQIEENSQVASYYKQGRYDLVVANVESRCYVDSLTQANRIIQLAQSEKEKVLSQINNCKLKIQAMLRLQRPNLIQEFGDCACDKLCLTRFALTQQWIDAIEHIDSIFILLAVIDTYGYSYNKEQNSLYEELLSIADQYNIRLLRIEQARMNLANNYYHAGNFVLAERTYAIMLNNMLQLYDTSMPYKIALSKMFMSAISLYSNMNIADERPQKIFAQWENAIQTWDKSSLAYLYSIGNMIAIQITMLNINNIEDTHKGFEIIPIGDKIFYQLIEQRNVFSNDEIREVIYLGIVLACFLIDRYEQLSDKERAFVYINNTLDNAASIAKELYRVDSDSACQLLSMIYHNKGFVLTKRGQNDDYILAEKVYMKAVNYRRQLYRLNNGIDSKEQLAESLVNLGACQKWLDKVPQAISTAQEAIEKYRMCLREIQNSAMNGILEYAEMNFYKAKQLLGSIYAENTNNFKEEGLSILQECWSWAQRHTNCNYYHSFVGTSYRILKQHDQI